LFGALLARPGQWQYGYDLTKELGVRTGSLYPLLIRLTDEGLLEAEWQPPSRQGRPARHGYRLTSAGTAFASQAINEASVPGDDRGLAPA
jgi:DNA-binding PadR family transcriptional regulator